MSRKILSIVILALIAGTVLVWSKTRQDPTTKNYTPPKQTQQTQNASGYPVDPQHSSVQTFLPDYSPTLLRYTFTGKIGSIAETAEGTQLVLQPASDLPDMVLIKDTRIWNISADGKTTAASIQNLKVGLVVDITMDYEKDQERWILRDVYIPADRNP